LFLEELVLELVLSFGELVLGEVLILEGFFMDSGSAVMPMVLAMFVMLVLPMVLAMFVMLVMFFIENGGLFVMFAAKNAGLFVLGILFCG
jgi:hypothetical protein